MIAPVPAEPVDADELLDPAFYRPLDGLDGERFHAGRATTGPWFSDAQHGGPPAALLVRAVERCAAADLQLSRVTVEVLGPIPAGEVAVRAAVERPGRTISLVGAQLEAGGRVVLRARAWCAAAGDTAAVAGGAPDPLPGPEEGRPGAGRPDGWLPGYLDAVEWRWLSGWLAEPGPGCAWARPRIPLVEGEETTPWQRLALVADSANGIGAPLDVRRWLFVNTELTLHVHRPPRGEWIGVDAATVVGPTGLGTAAGRLFDADGAVGRSTQALVVRPR